MADEPRRSGRATKGQHKNASSSPPPVPKPAAKAAPPKKGKKAASQPASDDGEEEEDDEIRCICGNTNPKDRRAFIGCDACSVWQHNVCMGMPDDDDEVGEHYFCERCRPEEHVETLEAMEKGEKIWETRNKIYQQEKKMSKNRKAKTGKAGWLKREGKVQPEPEPELPAETKEAGNKRKRESEVPQPEAQAEAPEPEPAAEKPARGGRQEKRRKSSALEKKAAEDPDTAIVAIEKLPIDRKKIAQQLSKIIQEGVEEKITEGTWSTPDGQTAKSIGDSHASKIEYALQMNHEGPANKVYAQQFRMLNANLKQNKSLFNELLAGKVAADDLAVMSSSEMASDKLQQERAAMKAESDRQATIDQKESLPRYRRTHKGDELVEDEDAVTTSAPVSRPVRQSIADAEMAGMDSGSPHGENASGSASQQMQAPDIGKRPSAAGQDRRSSSQNFDVNSIWAKTPQSPTQTSVRPMQMPAKRRSSVQQPQADGAKEDADVDRMLADDNDNDTYSPADYSSGDAIVWRGKIVQSSGDSEPTVNARFVAGRDVAATIPWKDLLPSKLTIDGRLQVPKAEEYLCGLQWSHSSDVSVLSLTAYDDAAAFNTVFEYFQTRQRYAVVNKDKPRMVKDLYIIPIEPGAKLPDHVDMLEHCTIKHPIEERLLLATFVVARPPTDTPTAASAEPTPQQLPHHQPANGHHLPPHLLQGPQGSPLQTSGPQFSPAPPQPFGTGSPIPPNPYSSGTPVQHAPTPPYPVAQFQAPPPVYGQPQQTPPQGFAPQQQQPPPITNPLAASILGDLLFAPTAQDVLRSDPGVGEEQLRNLAKILQEDEDCRTNMMALAAKLGAGLGN